MKKRILIIGLDGFTWQVGYPMIQRGVMPTLGSLVHNGTHGILESVFPYETCPAWASFQTGCHPNKNGIFSFYKYDDQLNGFRLNHYRDIQVPTILDILSRKGKKCVWMNLPLTYPAPQIDGVVIPGLMCPEISPETVYPGDTFNRYLSSRPYQIVNDTRCKTIQEFVKQSCETEHLRCEIALRLMEDTDWDVFYFQVQSTDLLQHRYWWALDSSAHGYTESDFNTASVFYRTCDELIGRLLEKAGCDTEIAIVSDHGFTKQNYSFAVNRWLMENNFLKIKPRETSAWQQIKDNHTILKHLCGGYGKVKTEVIELLHRAGLVGQTIERAPSLDTELSGLRTGIDFAQSDAYVLGAMGGMLYLNPSLENPSAKWMEIKQRLLEDFGPDSRTPIIREIKTGTEQYQAKHQNIRLPDMTIEFQDGVVLATSPFCSSVVESHLNQRQQQPGTHSRQGVFVFHGKAFKPGFTMSGTIPDIVPTVLAYLGLPVPSYLDGRVLGDLFTCQPDITYDEVDLSPPSAASGGSDAEQALIEKRLRELGYL